MSGDARPRVGRAARRALALGVLLLATMPVPPALAAGSRGSAAQDGWWNRLQGPVEGEPEGNPLRSLIPPAPKPLTVPADAIATSGGAGQVDKVAAVGIDLALADGDTVEALVLRLTEAVGSGANVGSDQAKVVACPATNAWGPGAQNGAWRDRPVADCGLGSAEGVRAEDHSWAFDLTAMARLWGDPVAPLAPNGIVLSIDPGASPSPVQVSWLNFDSGQIVVTLATCCPTAYSRAPGGPTAAEPFAAEPPAPTPGGPYLESAADARAFPAERGGLAADPLAYASGRPTFAAADPAVSATPDSGGPSGATAEAAPSAPPAQGPVLRARAAVGFWERVPAPTALLVPVAVGLAVLIGVVLGPVGRPSPVFAREGGLSRALARRSSGDPA